MNSYLTSHMRARPQVIRRSFDVVTTDGKKVSVFGVKGANGEWMLEVSRGGEWVSLGIAQKGLRGIWSLTTEDDIFIHSTLQAVIVRALEVTE